VKQRGLNDDQAHSLLRYHDEQVDGLVEAARPDLAWVPGSGPHPGRRRSVWDRRAPAFMVGSPTWFKNRYVDAKYWAFKLRASSAYRTPPSLKTTSL